MEISNKNPRYLIRPRIAVIALFLIPFLALPLLPDRAQFIGKRIKDIQFEGLRNVSADDAAGFLSLEKGAIIEERSLNDDIKALFKSGYFDKVSLRGVFEADGVTLVFQVNELPRIREIEFVGTDKIYSADLKTLVGIKEGEVYSEQRVKAAVPKIKDKYRTEGYFLTEVWYRISDLDTANEITVKFIIDEGENIPISRINIIGTRNLDPEDILSVLEQKEEGIIEDGVFDENKFEQDKYKILGYAKSQGYVDADLDPTGTGYEIRWRTPSKPEDGRVVIVTYKLIESDIRFFGGYSLEFDPETINEELNPRERPRKKKVEPVPIYKKEDLLNAMEFADNDVATVFDEGKFFRDRTVIQESYSTQGYVFAQVQPNFVNFTFDDATLAKYKKCRDIPAPANDLERKCKKEANWLPLAALEKRLKENPEERGRTLRHVHYTVRENNLAYIDSIIIKGMVKTQERVVRRELLVKEGQLFNSALVNRSREKIFNLGYFKEVNLQMRPGSDDQKLNLIIDVEEQPTGTISLGGGYGTQSGFSIFTEVGENNLNGTGQRISGKIQYGPLTKQISGQWTDPWIYEACDNSTGSFWRNKLKAFEGSGDYDSIDKVAISLQNNYSEIGKVIRAYVAESKGDKSIEAMDRLKVRIRGLLKGFVSEEEECFRSIPRPWSLSLFASYATETIQSSSITISEDPNDLFEGSSYDISSVGVGVGVSHTFFLNWAHYHRYSPSWSIAAKPTSLAANEILRRVNLGWQFKSALTNGLIYDTRDNVFNPTNGLNLDLSVEIVGQALGGQDHYNQYTFSTKYYTWWFDYTFGGLFRKQALKRWRVVSEFRLSGTFTHETAPFNRRQNKEINPYIEPQDRLYLGGYETLRGYDYRDDASFPAPWRDGGSHMILAGTELRFPIEPSLVWLAAFLDAGTMFDNIGEFTGDNKTYTDSYRDIVAASNVRLDATQLYLLERYNLLTYARYPFDSYYDWNDPRRAVLSARNLSLDRTLYSWGFGVRIQIPVLPLRLFLAQKLYHKSGLKLKPIPGDSKFQFVFGIGDFRF
ncbi:MAG: outer membrane protein assembly factor [Leptospirales bacterium]|nr:outer membrane protein assembly factor [Leptospirales bacterium]